MRFLIVLALMLPSIVHAQQFVPFTVEQKDYDDLKTFLNEQVPPKYGSPIWSWLQNLEMKAKAEADKKGEEKK